MGILGKGLKLLGSAALGAVGVASTVVRACASGAGMDEVADFVGEIQNKSLDTVRDMWTPDEEKTEEYYEAMADRQQARAESAMRTGEQYRRKCEKMMDKE